MNRSILQVISTPLNGIRMYRLGQHKWQQTASDCPFVIVPACRFRICPFFVHCCSLHAWPDGFFRLVSGGMRRKLLCRHRKTRCYQSLAAKPASGCALGLFGGTRLKTALFHWVPAIYYIKSFSHQCDNFNIN